MATTVTNPARDARRAARLEQRISAGGLGPGRLAALQARLADLQGGTAAPQAAAPTAQALGDLTVAPRGITSYQLAAGQGSPGYASTFTPTGAYTSTQTVPVYDDLIARGWTPEQAQANIAAIEQQNAAAQREIDRQYEAWYQTYKDMKQSEIATAQFKNDRFGYLMVPENLAAVGLPADTAASSLTVPQRMALQGLLTGAWQAERQDEALVNWERGNALRAAAGLPPMERPDLYRGASPTFTSAPPWWTPELMASWQAGSSPVAVPARQPVAAAAGPARNGPEQNPAGQNRGWIEALSPGQLEALRLMWLERGGVG